MKLSKLQLDLLQEMVNGRVVHYMGYMGRFNPTPYYFASGGGHPRVTKQIEALIKRGLVKLVRETYASAQAVPTEKGIEYIKSLVDTNKS